MNPADIPSKPVAQIVHRVDRAKAKPRIDLNIKRVCVSPLSIESVSIPSGLTLRESIPGIGPLDLPDKFAMNYAFPDGSDKDRLTFYYSGKPLLPDYIERFRQLLSKATPDGIVCSEEEIRAMKVPLGPRLGRNQYTMGKTKTYSTFLRSCTLQFIAGVPMVFVEGSYEKLAPPDNEFYGASFLIPGRDGAVGQIFVQGKLDAVKRGILLEVLRSIEWSKLQVSAPEA